MIRVLKEEVIFEIRSWWWWRNRKLEFLSDSLWISFKVEKKFLPFGESSTFEVIRIVDKYTKKKKKVTSDPKFLFLKIITPNNQSSKFILKTILKDVNPSWIISGIIIFPLKLGKRVDSNRDDFFLGCKKNGPHIYYFETLSKSSIGFSPRD